jgi:outer membrane protein OmpA-like peptidoglycan-associated protein
MATTGGVERLKELLFDSEARAFSELTRRVDQVFDRAGTEERFRGSVAEVLDGALRAAEVSRHAELSSAVAPLIVKTIKTEIRNSQDELVEAIYPATGRIVQAYLTSALRDLANDINRRFELNPVMLRLRSLITGKSVAELAIAATQRLRLEEVYLIRRGSGELMARWPEVRNPNGGRDHVMSGVLAAINEYSSKALQDQGAALRQIDFGERRLYLRASPLYLLAAKCSGTAAASVESTLDDAFLGAIEELHKSQRLAEGLGGGRDIKPTISLQDLHQDIEKRISKRHAEIAGRGVSPAKVLAWGTGLALVAWLSWSAYTSYVSDQVHGIAAKAVASNSDVASYPIEISVGWLGRSVTVEGLTPTDESRAAVIASLEQALPKAEIRDRLRALPNDIAVMEPKVESVRQEVADIQPEIAIVRENVLGLEPKIADVKGEVSALGASTTRRDIESALDRAARNLDDVSVELARIEDASGETSSVVAATAAAALKGRNEIETLRKDADPGAARATPASLEASLDLETELRQSGTALSLLLEGGAGPALAESGPKAKSDGMTGAAEALADETERLARITVAVSQVLAFKRNLPPPPGPSARDRLEAWTRAHAVFFSEDTNYRDEAIATQMLDELAALMRETKVLVRVVGYTDFKGGNERNSPLSEARSQKVAAALVSRGIPQARLATVGRKDNQDLSQVVGETSPNRRVEFEVGFEGEGAE